MIQDLNSVIVEGFVARYQELGESLVTVGGQLEEDEPFLGALELVVPPVRGRDRAGDLAARGEARLDRRLGQPHRFGPGVSRRLHLQVLAAVKAACVGSCHAT